MKKQDTLIAFKLSSDIAEQLRIAAEQEERTVSAIIRVAIKNYLSHYSIKQNDCSTATGEDAK